MLLFISIWGVVSSCRSVKPVSFGAGNYSGRHHPVAAHLNEGAKIQQAAGNKRVYKQTPRSLTQTMEMMAARSQPFPYTGDIESCQWLQFKYALVMDVPVEALGNLNLLGYMEEWYGTPYRYGGSGKEGIDCSAFCADLLAIIFGTAIPRTVKEQFQACRRIGKTDLREGDMVFFNTTGSISHVGIYLLNNKFVHASTSAGVMISDLNEPYFYKRYAGAGRVK